MTPSPLVMKLSLGSSMNTLFMSLASLWPKSKRRSWEELQRRTVDRLCLLWIEKLNIGLTLVLENLFLCLMTSSMSRWKARETSMAFIRKIKNWDLKIEWSLRRKTWSWKTFLMKRLRKCLKTYLISWWRSSNCISVERTKNHMTTMDLRVLGLKTIGL